MPNTAHTLSSQMLTALPTRMLFTAGMVLALAIPAMAQENEQTVTFINTEGAEIGTASLTGTNVGLLIELDLGDLPPDSWHGFHIHETSECDAKDGFKSAGGHFSTSETSHGFLTDGGPHAGDMPNQYVGADGTLKTQVLNTFAFLGGENDNVSGRALMIHSGPDDYQSQPSGDAGNRIACAVIE
tara:strand:+ start:572 stop:1126 length:555 start_codon:yes stop_codon:yes gene_type:complete